MLGSRNMQKKGPVSGDVLNEGMMGIVEHDFMYFRIKPTSIFFIEKEKSGHTNVGYVVLARAIYGRGWGACKHHRCNQTLSFRR